MGMHVGGPEPQGTESANKIRFYMMPEQSFDAHPI